MGAIAAVSFDVGGTLLFMDPSPDVILAELCRDCGIEITPAAAARAYARGETWFNVHHDLYARDPQEFWRQGNRMLLELLGVRDDLDARAVFITEGFSRRTGGWSIYPEVPEVLEALRGRGLPMAVVSNWDPGLEHLLTRVGVRELFSVIIGSSDVGVAKPDPGIFRLATEALGTPPAQTLHVGDLYDYDIVGARAAGLIPVLVERHTQRGSVFSPAPEAYDGLRVADLRGLMPIVDDHRGVVGAAS